MVDKTEVSQQKIAIGCSCFFTPDVCIKIVRYFAENIAPDWNNLHTGQMPHSLIIFMVSHNYAIRCLSKMQHNPIAQFTRFGKQIGEAQIVKGRDKWLVDKMWQ